MTKMTETKKERLGIASPIQPKRNLTAAECVELQEMIRIANAENFKAKQVRGNTALVPRGLEVAGEVEAMARLLENAKNLFVSQLLKQCGYEDGVRCSLNLSTGEVVPEITEKTETK